MASIIEAFDSTVKEAFAGVKVLVWALPVCIGYSFFKSGSGISFVFNAVLALLLIGYLTEISNNIIIKKDRILPGINVVSYAFHGLLTIAVMLPYAALSWLVWFLIDTYINIPDEVWGLTVKVIGAFLALSFTLTAFAMYTRKLNPLEAFNLKKYFMGFGEVFVSFSYLIVKLAAWSVLIIGFLMYVFSLFIGFDNVIWQYIMCAIVVFYLFLGANYIAQTSEEVYTFIEKEENEKKAKQAISKMEAENKLK